MGEQIRLGKVVLFIVVVVIMGLVGMYYAPTIVTTYAGIDTTDFNDFVKAGIAFAPFAFVGFILYLAYNSRFGGK